MKKAVFFGGIVACGTLLSILGYEAHIAETKAIDSAVYFAETVPISPSPSKYLAETVPISSSPSKV